MKKLMIAAAIVCAAAFAQAAAIDWQVVTTKIKSTQGGKYSAFANGDITAYVFDSTTWGGLTKVTMDAFVGDSAKYLDKSGFVQDGSSPQGVTHKTGVDGTPITPGVRTLTNDNWTENTGIDLVYVLVDSSEDTWTYAAIDVTPIARDLQAGNNHTGELTKELAQLNSLTWSDVSSGDVPEPTSAMLILLGMAGLALRRRRA